MYVCAFCVWEPLGLTIQLAHVLPLVRYLREGDEKGETEKGEEGGGGGVVVDGGMPH